MKKLIAGLLIIALSFTMLPCSTFANTSEKKFEKITLDDGLEIISEVSANIIKVETYTEEGQLDNYTVVDKKTGIVKFVDSDGIQHFSNLTDYLLTEDEINQPDYNDIVIDNKLEVSLKSQSNLEHDSSNLVTPMALYTEPIENNGLSISLWDNDYNEKYYYLGNSSVYYSNETGYLYRKIDSLTKHEGHKVTFSAGTAVSTVLGVILGVFTGGTWTVAVITGLLATSGGVLVDYFSGTFDYRTYHYLYKVRVDGKVTFTTNRNISYWVSYNDQTETINFKQKSFNYGFSMSNLNMIQAGIDNYITGNY